MEAILRVSRSRQHALTTALRVDMAYLCVGERTVFSLLLAPLFSVIFQGEAYGDGFGYRMGVIMTVFTCAMWVLTMAVADLQNGYRLRGIIPASRKSQVAARYVVGLVISVLSIAMIVLIDGLQVLVNPDWSFAGNLWVAPLGGFCTALMVALIVPTGYLWTKLGGLQVTMMVIYVVVLAVSILLSILPASVTRGLAHAANAIIAQRLWLVIAVLTTTVVAYGISYVIASRIFASRECTMSWKSVVKQCRFDCVGTGLFSVANMVFLLVFPVLSIVVSLVMIPTHVDEHVASGLMGGCGGLASAMACMSALGPASSEESAGPSAMRGLIPVSRTAQVVGRYLFLLVVGLLWALDVVICGGVFIVFGDIADMGWIGTLAAGAFIFALAIILGSVLLACAYRFTFRKMMVASGVVLVGLYAVIALLARLPVDWQWLLLNITDFLAIWWHTALVLAVLCLLAYFGSMLIAIRIYRAKEL